MDGALKLRMAYDAQEILSEEDIDELLASSVLVRNLCSNFEIKGLFPIWRILALAEIPYSNRLVYTKELMDYVIKIFGTSKGFSLDGRSDGILPCYNGMLLEAFSKLSFEHEFIEAAVEWILNYQLFERHSQTSWKGKGIQKYGGCLKEIPCYVGIIKSLKGLLYYQKMFDKQDDRITACIEKGIHYVKAHDWVYKLSDAQPITKHMMDITFPQSYQLNVIELLELMFIYDASIMPNDRIIDYIMSKRHKDGYWKINYIYKAKGYATFDRRGEEGKWITYLLNKYVLKRNL